MTLCLTKSNWCGKRGREARHRGSDSPAPLTPPPPALLNGQPAKASGAFIYAFNFKQDQWACRSPFHISNASSDVCHRFSNKKLACKTSTTQRGWRRKLLFKQLRLKLAREKERKTGAAGLRHPENFLQRELTDWINALKSCRCSLDK